MGLDGRLRNFGVQGFIKWNVYNTSTEYTGVMKELNVTLIVE